MFLLLNILLIFLSKPILAQSPSPKLSFDETTIRENIKKRIEQAISITNHNLQKTQLVLAKLVSITDETLSIEKDDQTILVSLKPTTEVVDLKNTKLKITDLEINSYLIVLGVLDDSDNILADKVIFQKELPKHTKQTLLATITDFNKPNRTLTVTPAESSDPLTFNIPKTCQFHSNPNQPPTTTLPKDYLTGDQVLLIYENNPKNTTGLNLLLITKTNSNDQITE